MSLPISGFMPIPLAIMPPFMAYQSLVMGDAFGRAFQFGKRKISAMSNEEFNKLDIVTMFESISNEYVRMIPTVKDAMSQSVDLQVAIVKELLRVIPELGKALFSAETFPHSAHGHPFGDVIPHGDTSTTTETETGKESIIEDDPIKTKRTSLADAIHKRLDMKYRELDNTVEWRAGAQRTIDSTGRNSASSSAKNRAKLKIAQYNNRITVLTKEIKDLQVKYKEETGKFYPFKQHHTLNQL